MLELLAFVLRLGLVSFAVAVAAGALGKTTVLVPLLSAHQLSARDTAGMTLLTGDHGALLTSHAAAAGDWPDHCGWLPGHVRSAAGRVGGAPG